MRKKLLIGLLACIMLLSFCLPVMAADEMLISPNPLSSSSPVSFTVLRIDYPEGEAMEYREYSMLKARFKDDGTIIPLSDYYDGMIFATVPETYADREIEAVMTEQRVFSDYDTSIIGFHYMNELSACDVIVGNQYNEAKPLDTITRAEAVTMIARAFGLDRLSAAPSGFTDVPDNAWFAHNVAIAKQYGIVNGVSAAEFAPERAVTREEMLVMTARAILAAGLRNAPADDAEPNIELADADKISTWAKAAYALIGNFGESRIEYDESAFATDGGYMTIYYADPNLPAERGFAAGILTKVLNLCQTYPSKNAIKFGFDKAMPTIDGSTSTYPFTDAVYQALFSCGAYHLEKPAKHSKSHASYERVINGEVDMLFASAKPTDDLLQLAAEKGVELEFHEIAYDAMIFFTNADNPATGLTSEQISNIYVDNAYDNWQQIGGPDALLYPYCRNNDSGSHAHMQKYFLNGHEINETIRQETTSTTMSNVLTDVMGAQTSEPTGYGLGYSIFYYFNNMDLFYNTKSDLKLLEIDGIAPTDETIADSSYPLCSNAYIVFRADTPKNSPAYKMLEFMLTPDGQYCVEIAGYGKYITK